ncbi:unnamed protein product [Calypogeia fissa]
MEELSPVHRYAAGALFSLALNQAQIHRQSPVPEAELSEEDGPSYLTLAEEDGGAPWGSESCGLLRHVLRYLNIDEHAWPGIEITAALPDAKHHIGPFIRILQEDSVDVDLPSSTVPSSASDGKSAKPERSVAALAKAIDAMALSLEEFAEARPAAGEKTFEETFAAHVASAQNEQPSTSVPDSAQRWASMKKPLLERQASDSQSPRGMKKPSVERQGSESQSPRGSVKKTEPDIPPVEEDKEAVERRTLVKQRKVAVLYEVLTACVADSPDEKAGKSVLRAGYDARQRAAIRLLALWMDVEWQKVAAIELMVAYMAMAAEKEREAGKTAQAEEKQSWAKWRRGGIIGAAAVTGGVLLAVTGGLAAPAIAAGLTALAPVLGIGGLATVVGSAAGSVAVAASFGAAGAGLAGTKMARRTGGVEEFMFLPIGDNHQQGRLAVGIMVSGIIFEAEDFTKPWEGPDWDLERYALRWETKELTAVSTAIEDWLASSAARELFKAGAMMTVLAGLVAALAWPATLLAATDWIDSKWTVAVDRSDKAGVLLAKCLLRGTQGNRPVTLIGFSLGARVIFSCLEYLAKKGDAGSIVERVVLLGAPITLDEKKWKTVRKVVSGRFINAYSTSDWILGVIYRASFVTQGLAGIQNVPIPGIENIDVTEIVNGHSMYLTKTSEILEALDIDSFYPIYPSKLNPAPLAIEAP